MEILADRAIRGHKNKADEILWEAGLSPLRRASELSEKEIKNLYSSAKKFLKLSIKKGGTSSRNYRKPDVLIFVRNTKYSY